MWINGWSGVGSVMSSLSCVLTWSCQYPFGVLGMFNVHYRFFFFLLKITWSWLMAWPAHPSNFIVVYSLKFLLSGASEQIGLFNS